MGNKCLPSAMTDLVRKYGERDILLFAQSLLAQQLIEVEFEDMKGSIERRFNAEPLTPSTLEQFDKII